MNILYHIFIGLSIGVILGTIIGAIKSILWKKTDSPDKIEALQHLIKKISNVLKYITFLCLILGLIWCIYFLILSAAIPEQVDYANNMAELIVAVLTVISILFAFIEFIQHKENN